MVELLLSYGADPTYLPSPGPGMGVGVGVGTVARVGEGRSPLTLAAEYGDLQVRAAVRHPVVHVYCDGTPPRGACVLWPYTTP